jgi:hypothetical protein
MTSSAADSFAFEPFSVPHLAALAVVALAGALAFHLGRTLGPSRRKAAGRLLALLILGYGGAVYTHQALAWGWAGPGPSRSTCATLPSSSASRRSGARGRC